MNFFNIKKYCLIILRTQDFFFFSGEKTGIEYAEFTLEETEI